MQFNLTFNKPAAAMFFAEGAQAVKVKVVGKGQVQFKPSAKESGRDVFPLTGRTRGGVGITIGGKFAEEFLQATKMDRSTHMALEQTSYKWIAGHAVDGKPSKIVPTARLWRSVDEAATKEETAPKRAPRKARVAKAEAATTGRGRRAKAAEGATTRSPRRAAKADKAQAAAKTPRKTRAPRAAKQEQTAEASA